MQGSKALIWPSGAIAFPLLAAVTVLTILDAVSSNIRYLALTIAAAALDVIALGSLTLAITIAIRGGFWSKANHDSLWHAIVVPAICACFGLVSAAVTLAELGLTRRRSNGSNSTTRNTVAIVLCGVAVATQAVFYFAVVVSATSAGLYHRSQSTSRPRTPEQKTRPMSLRILTPPRAQVRQDEEEPPKPLNDSTSSFPTVLSSTQVVRPITSKTRLIRTPTTEQSRLSHSLRSSIDSLNRGDAFDSWDTSDVDVETRDTVLSASQRRKGTLEPIPGSRPSSPGRPLEGPFVEPSSSPATSPTAVDPNSSPYSYRPDTARSENNPYARRANSTVSLSSMSPTSPSASEAHIHPLFRTDSPTPPPAHTPNTIIHASPIGGQFIPQPPRAFSRMNSRETIRAGSASPLVHSKSFVSERGSVDSSAPPSRALTPPIPEFVLNGAN